MLNKFMEEKGRLAESWAMPTQPANPVVSQSPDSATTSTDPSATPPEPQLLSCHCDHLGLGTQMSWGHRQSFQMCLATCPARSIQSPFFLAPEPVYPQMQTRVHDHIHTCMVIRVHTADATCLREQAL